MSLLSPEPDMQKHNYDYVLALLGLIIVLTALTVRCTPGTVSAFLPVAETIAEIANKVCIEGDEVGACISKCDDAQRNCPCGVISATVSKSGEVTAYQCLPCDVEETPDTQQKTE